ncbi:hypothetical protein DSL92_06930 [Billgrantia gudaonensis]|uniref:Uncharacterized protein n=1 Tax=Billgrantia gudaonensis TaxID=376427 RepID=A0A432JIG2_9GAMM|nr:hypothetical protein DSL92_06930 [Halomonas gudaonensis]
MPSACRGANWCSLPVPVRPCRSACPGARRPVFKSTTSTTIAPSMGLEALNRPARVVIVGFGLVGCEFANDLAAGGASGGAGGARGAPLPRLLPEPLGRALGEAFGEAGMSLHAVQRGRVLAAGRCRGRRAR